MRWVFLEAHDFFEELIIAASLPLKAPEAAPPPPSGQILEWLLFQNVFPSLKEGENQLIDVQKLRYLIEHVPLTVLNAPAVAVACIPVIRLLRNEVERSSNILQTRGRPAEQ
ncbi:hypothetical protein KM043_017589 [Ampulex compressa]|nr:hypothetical protein KM043_017589 [Ampulex compressa]